MAGSWLLKKDDIVMVMKGRERGKKGKVLAFYPDQDSITVEKLNLYKRHMKPSGQNKGGIVEKEGKIHYSNVLLVCDKCGKGVRVKSKKLEDGSRVRVCRKCGDAIDKI
ncbi:50S ribosomal protein L24 [Nitrospina gracilis 3/211]|uniref:Large ribosomal subunit protein uL24 n=1 Tax=Nitrospina gracilis (strain 3/211) TaxID=1266370 RepID=M1YXA6_NITG3|nr:MULTISPECIES: 50S ribosomal protein L24 [Nitrospina]MCF8723269.1 large subunit ribosomal protein L24 [Nitrospina sp. Nb-3]CCQ90319.1 50S ribosomal protein L24 [Nitrospina gracilis 3/211]